MRRLTSKLTRRIAEHRRLRKPTTFHIALADRIAQLNQAAWAAITTDDSYFFSTEYLTLLEQVGPDNLEPKYALIYDDEGPVAAVCMQIVKISLAQLREAGDDTIVPGFSALLKGKRKLEQSVTQRVLVCGNLLTYGMHAAAFAEDVDPTDIWPAIAEALYRVRRAEKIAGQTNIVLVKDMPNEAYLQSKALGKLSYGAIETEPNMLLTLDPAWKSHADYLGSMVSKYRSAVKNQVLEPIDKSGCTVETLTDVANHANRIQALYLQVHGNASLRPFTLRPEYWPSLAATGTERVIFTVIKRDGKLLGFIATLKDGEMAYAYHIGFDRDAAAEGLPIYLRLLHAAIAQSIAFGCKQISFGRTALEPKARLGCQPEPIRMWLRHRQPLLNQFVKPMLKLIQHEEAPESNPFKRSATAK
ncbi:GNAT family N-acetyltransferase [Chitinivorax sp. B]|uniref:GNAT family N-acetyltransferase n=1 Tax=Chitinivorax sp. B TaxID=2502235 RepID=UPI0010F61334|nr:GNAT family N-acetyltransferase [Chitinivorax sp. B]